MYNRFRLAFTALTLALIISFTSALTINITTPAQNANYSTTNISLNFALDSTTNTSCILQLNEINTTQPTCANTTLTGQQSVNNLTIFANDSDGNYTFQETTFNIDSNAPTTTTNIQNITSTSATINITTNEESNYTLNYWTTPTNISTTQNTNYTLNTTFNLTNLLATTTYYYNTTTCDAQSNCNTTQTANFTTNTPPQITLNNPNSNASNTITFNATATDDTNLTTVTFTLANQTWNTTLNATNITTYWQTTFNTTNLTDGQYNLTATAVDASNEQNTTTPRAITIDNTKPTLQLFTTINGTKIKTTTINLNYTATDLTLDNCWYVLDAQTVNILNCQNTTISQLTQSPHALTLYVNDSQNQTNSLQINFTIDTTNPTISNFDFDRINTTVNLTWTTNEITNYTIRFGINNTFESIRTNATFATTFNLQLNELEYAKTYNFNLTTCDEANNCANSTLSISIPNAPATQASQSSASGASAAAAPAAETPALKNAKIAATDAAQTAITTPNTTTQTNNSQNALTQNTTNTNEISSITGFATATDKNNFAIGLALLSGLSILMYGYKQPLIQRVKSKKTTKKHAKKETPKTKEKEKNRYAYLEQVNGKKIHFPIEHKPHHTNQHVQKVKFKNGSLADQLVHAIKKRV